MIERKLFYLFVILILSENYSIDHDQMTKETNYIDIINFL
jgi:hypothetical protein